MSAEHDDHTGGFDDHTGGFDDHDAPGGFDHHDPPEELTPEPGNAPDVLGDEGAPAGLDHLSADELALPPDLDVDDSPPDDVPEAWGDDAQPADDEPEFAGWLDDNLRTEADAGVGDASSEKLVDRAIERLRGEPDS